MVSAITWFITVLIQIKCVHCIFIGNESPNIVPKANSIQIMGNAVNRRIMFEYRYCLLVSTVDQTRSNTLKAIRRAMNNWDGSYINKALESHNRELKFTLNQKCCQKITATKPGKPDEVYLYGYSIKPKCVDLIITFVKPGDEGNPFINRNSDKEVMFRGDKHPKEILLNDKHQFTDKKITNVIKHELGHFLGLDDNYDDENESIKSIMCPSCRNTRVNDFDRTNLVEIFRKKINKCDVKENGVEISSKIEDLQFEDVQNLQLTELPDFIYTTQHTVNFILGDLLWSFNWKDLPKLGTPQKPPQKPRQKPLQKPPQFVSKLFPLDLAIMIKGSSQGPSQGKADSVFELVFHDKTIWFVIKRDKIKMFDGANVTNYELSDFIRGYEDSIKTVLFLSQKDIIIFTKKFYYILDLEQWYSRIDSGRLLRAKRKRYSTHNRVMKQVKLVYYINPGDFTIFQAYTDSSFLGTFRVKNKHWLSPIVMDEIPNTPEVPLPVFHTKDDRPPVEPEQQKYL